MKLLMITWGDNGDGTFSVIRAVVTRVSKTEHRLLLQNNYGKQYPRWAELKDAFKYGIEITETKMKSKVVVEATIEGEDEAPEQVKEVVKEPAKKSGILSKKIISKEQAEKQ